MISAVISSYTPVKQSAVFAVKISDDDGNTHERVVPTTSRNAYSTQLFAVKYVCEAVENKDVALQIITQMPYIANTFQKDTDGSWKKTRKRGANASLVDEVKKLLEAFKSLSMTIDTDDKPIKLQAIAKSYSSI